MKRLRDTTPVSEWPCNIPDELWTVEIFGKHLTEYQKPNANPIWAEGYLRVVVDPVNPKSKYARESKEWWDKVRRWARS